MHEPRIFNLIMRLIFLPTATFLNREIKLIVTVFTLVQIKYT